MKKCKLFECRDMLTLCENLVRNRNVSNEIKEETILKYISFARKLLEIVNSFEDIKVKSVLLASTYKNYKDFLNEMKNSNLYPTLSGNVKELIEKEYSKLEKLL